MQHVPRQERPRERLLSFGPQSLTTAELIAIILGSGTKEHSVLEVSNHIVSVFGDIQGLANATVEELCQIKGVGPAKAIQLRAAFNLGLRVSQISPAEKIPVRTAADAYKVVKGVLEREMREVVLAILLDVKGYMIKCQTISLGTLYSSLIHPREVFHPAIKHSAASLVLAHNHPSGDPSPSEEDILVTRRLADSAALMGIPLQDHLVVGCGSYVSIKELYPEVFFT